MKNKNYTLAITNKYSGIISVYFITSVINFIANILIYNALSREAAGRYTLIWGLCLVIGHLAILGQDRQILRLLALKGIEKFSWVIECNITVIISMLTAIAASIILTHFYHLGLQEFFAVVLACMAIIILKVFGGILRAGGYYTLTAISFRSLHLIFSFSVLAFFVLKLMTYNRLMSLIIIASCLSMLLTLRLTIGRFKVGEGRIGLRERISSIIFLGFTISTIIISYGDRLILGKIVSEAQLGIYGAVAVFMKGFELVENGVEVALVPELCKARQVDRWGIFKKFFILGIVLAVAYNLITPYLIKFLYRAKYDSGIVLVPISAAIGFFRILSIFPNSAFQGPTDIKGAKSYVTFNYLATFIVCFAIWQGAVYNGIIGAMYGLLFGYIVRCLGAYYFFLKFFQRVNTEIECNF